LAYLIALTSFSEPGVRLFVSTGCHSAALLNPQPEDLIAKPNIEIFPSNQITTLYQAFAEQIWQPDSQNAFVEPAEVLLMSVKYDQQYGPKVLFKIEEDFYIGEHDHSGDEVMASRLTLLRTCSDRFLAGNSVVTAQLRANEGVLKGDQARLRERRQALTTVNVRPLYPNTLISNTELKSLIHLPCLFQGKDARQALVTALKYYTSVAQLSGEEAKDASLVSTRIKVCLARPSERDCDVPLAADRSSSPPFQSWGKCLPSWTTNWTVSLVAQLIRHKESCADGLITSLSATGISSSLQSITDQQEKLFDTPELQRYRVRTLSHVSR
jgi:hypothetical protein